MGTTIGSRGTDVLVLVVDSFVDVVTLCDVANEVVVETNVEKVDVMVVVLDREQDPSSSLQLLTDDMSIRRTI